MEILDKSIIVEVDKKVAISFNKKYKDLDLKEVKREITDYLLCHKDKYKDKKVFAFIYDYDSNIAVTVMRRTPEYEIYDIIGFSDMVTPEETVEDYEEAQETKEVMKELKQQEKLEGVGV